MSKKNSLALTVFDYKDRARRSVGERAWRWGATLLTSHLPPWAHHHAIFILSRWDIHPGKQAGFTQKVPAVPQLSTWESRVCQTLLWLAKPHMGRGGFLTNPPTRSKSKCAIKNAHLCSSSRLSNAYASYPRDQEKWYRKWYRTPFIWYTIRIFLASSQGVWWCGGSFLLKHSLNFGKVRNRKSTCWKTPIWMLLRHSSA